MMLEAQKNSTAHRIQHIYSFLSFLNQKKVNVETSCYCSPPSFVRGKLKKNTTNGRSHCKTTSCLKAAFKVLVSSFSLSSWGRSSSWISHHQQYHSTHFAYLSWADKLPSHWCKKCLHQQRFFLGICFEWWGVSNVQACCDELSWHLSLRKASKRLCSYILINLHAKFPETG